MLIGIVADIHDAVEPLQSALALLRERRVKQIVTLGDAFDSFEPGDPGPRVANLLQDADAIGVWGNHDFGLSHEVSRQVRERADPSLLAFASRLVPQLVVGGCRFSHIEPWMDPCRLEDLWFYDGVPETSERAERSFQAVPERIIFIGHFHSRVILHREGKREWDRVRPTTLAPPHSYLVLVPAVIDGWCAMFDTERSLYTPIPCGPLASSLSGPPPGR
jgi:Calcineurin-like phosphoesterase superfamily domain